MKWTPHDALIRALANGSMPLSKGKAESDAIFGELSASSRKRAMTDLLTYAMDHKKRSQYGRLCGALIVGAASLGPAFLDGIDGGRLLIGTESRLGAALADFTARLSQAGDDLAPLCARFRTYLALFELKAATNQEFQRSIEILRERPFKFGKTLFAIANIAFLRGYFDFEGGRDLERLYRSFHSPEDVAEAVSSLVAVANDSAALESLDFTFPLAGLEQSAELDELLRYGRAVSRISEIEKMVTILGYELSMSRSGRRSVFVMKAGRTDVEYFMRLGFVRGEIGGTSSRLEASSRDDFRPLSIRRAVESFIDVFGEQLWEIKEADTKFKRLRVKIPLLPPLFEKIAGMGFYEDLVMRERLAQELEIPMKLKAEGKWEFVDGLDLDVFERAWRVVDFLNVVDILLLKRNEVDDVLLKNSLVRVAKRSDSIELLVACGLTDVQARAFLDLVAADVSKLRHLDIQGRPFLSIKPSTVQLSSGPRTSPPEIVHAPAVVALSNIVPNLQRTHGFRIRTNAEAFVQIAASNLSELFSKVKTNVPLKNGSQQTDVDVVAFAGNALYLFERKHSLSPTGAHQLRDPWQDILKGVSQLTTAMEILEVRLADYLAGWFPGTDRKSASEVVLKPCVLCSQRVFSGMTIGGIPIRDHASLAQVCGDAVVRVGYSDDGKQVRLRRYRLRPSEKPTLDDLDNYLSARATFFESFEPFMLPFTRLDAISDGLAIAHETYVFSMVEDRWVSRLEELGAQRLDDEVVFIGPGELPGASVQPPSANA